MDLKGKGRRLRARREEEWRAKDTETPLGRTEESARTARRAVPTVETHLRRTGRGTSVTDEIDAGSSSAASKSLG